jgi:hypothetical protein
VPGPDENRESWTAYVSQAAPTGSQRLRALGWGEGHTKAFAILQEAAGADLIPAIVTEPGDGGCTAETATGTIRATYGPNLLGAMAADPLRRPLIDDWIAVRSWPDGRHTAEAILSRRVTLFQAPTPRAARKTAAAPAETQSANQPAKSPAQPPAPAPRRATQRRAAPKRQSDDVPHRSDSGPDF